MKRRLPLILICLFIVSFVIVFNYYKVYSTEENNLENNITSFITRFEKTNEAIFIKKTKDIGNKRYVLFVFNDYLGDAELIKGLNGNYKIESTDTGSNLFQYRVRGINNKKYFVLAGKNYDFKIDYINVILDGKEYKFTIPQEEYFISYWPVSNDILNMFPSELKLYDKYDTEITDEIYLKYQHNEGLSRE